MHGNKSMKSIGAIFGVFLWAAIATGQSFQPANQAAFHSSLNDALKAIKMTQADLALRDDYLEKDDYRFPAIDSLMHAPLRMLNLAAGLLQDSLPEYSKLVNYSLRKFWLEGNPRDIVGRYSRTDRFDEITLYRIAYFLAGVKNQKAYELYNKENDAFLDSLVYGFTLLLEEDAADEFRSVDEMDSIQNYEEKWSARLAEMTAGVSPELFGLMGQALLDVFDNVMINDEMAGGFKARYHEFDTPYGKVCVGDSSAQEYAGDLFIVIDYGGDDIYDITKQGTANFTFVLDYGGNDLYRLPKNRINPYAMGASLLIDFAGDDVYQAGSWSLGAGLFGAGVLWDKKGNDRYEGDTFTMGAGCFGYGILRDDAGDDFYNAALFAQGFGFVRGLGMLFDAQGNDHYFAGGKYKDILRYEDHYISLSQGFGYGIRPYMSGGIGLLADKAGNDTYESDIFGQGCSYWWSLGVLADGGGNDKYLSFQYAQGSATHMTLGCLYDAGGDDFYLAKGVSQGCGHDRAAAILYDASGNDNYMAHDLSQGAGSANGIGIIADLGGLDSYLVKSALNTQGYGNPRRDYGSIGVFLDIGGEKDSYAGGPGRDSTWWDYSEWGAGIDE